MNIQIEDEIKELHLIARRVIKDSICEYLEVDDKVESMLNVEVQAFNGVYIRVLGYDVFSLIRDVDCYDTYHAKIRFPTFYIKEDTSEKDIERYNKRMKFLNLISSKEAFLKLKEISFNNLLTLNEEIESIIENQHVLRLYTCGGVPTGTQTCLKGGVYP